MVFGLQLVVVDAFVLTPQATQVAARWFGPSPDTPRGWMQQIALSASSHRTAVKPADWVSWAVLSTAFVLLAHGILQRIRK
jgi:hypothetical protein